MHSDWINRAASAAEVVAHVCSGMTVFLHGAAATPAPLVEALAARTDLEGVRIVHLHVEGLRPTSIPARSWPSGPWRLHSVNAQRARGEGIVEVVLETVVRCTEIDVN